MPFTSAYFKHYERRTNLSERMYGQVNTNADTPMVFAPRPVPTKRVLMPLQHLYKPSSTTIQDGNFNPETSFFPGNFTFNHYAKHVDTETQLKNINHAIQKGGNHRYIPGSNSDLYDTNYLVKQPILGELPHKPKPLLFHKEVTPIPMTNKSEYIQRTVGQGLFNNHTRQQLKDVDLKC